MLICTKSTTKCLQKWDATINVKITPSLTLKTWSWDYKVIFSEVREFLWLSIILVLCCKCCKSFISRNWLQSQSSCYWPIRWSTQSFRLMHHWKFIPVLEQAAHQKGKTCCVAASGIFFYRHTVLQNGKIPNVPWFTKTYKIIMENSLISAQNLLAYYR